MRIEKNKEKSRWFDELMNNMTWVSVILVLPCFRALITGFLGKKSTARPINVMREDTSNHCEKKEAS